MVLLKIPIVGLLPDRAVGRPTRRPRRPRDEDGGIGFAPRPRHPHHPRSRRAARAAARPARRRSRRRAGARAHRRACAWSRARPLYAALEAGRPGSAAAEPRRELRARIPRGDPRPALLGALRRDDPSAWSRRARSRSTRGTRRWCSRPASTCASGSSFRVFHNHRVTAIDLRDPPANLTEPITLRAGRAVRDPSGRVLPRRDARARRAARRHRRAHRGKVDRSAASA